LDLYAENILDHFKHPRNTGSLTAPTITHREENLSCGDDLTLSLLIEDDTIKSLAWHGEGCAISQAAMSLLSEGLIGLAVSDAEALTKEKILEILGVPVGPSRLKCALLCLHTLKNGLLVAKKQPPTHWLANVEIDNDE